MRGSNFRKKAAYWPLVFMCLLCIESTPASYGSQSAGVIGNGYREIAVRQTVSKILSILEIRSADGKALNKAAEKLSAMNDRELRLISSLCDRISADGDSAGADIAFSIITAMIVLS
jgi:hypothetical protein